MKKLKDPSDKSKVLTELINAHMQRFDNTRKIQWTFNSIFWTGIIVTAPFLSDPKYYNSDSKDSFVVYSVFIVIAYSIILFLFQRSLNWDKDKFKHYRTILEKMASILKKEKKEVVTWSVIWTLAQLTVTILLLTGVYFVIKI